MAAGEEQNILDPSCLSFYKMLHCYNNSSIVIV